MKKAIQTLEYKLKELQQARKLSRKLLRRKVKKNDWMREFTLKCDAENKISISELREAIKILSCYE